ncbi:hypothetical protein ACPUVO_18890 [Pseudocolwellia sp. HL-MZ19]|uniref:hypothetical protein n=1 Tax=Pseudocolwellia sp. HL-MZ19 TaxID=3400846 RepID=UPI003CF545B1
MLDKAFLNLSVGVFRIALVGILGLLLSKILIEYLGNETYGVIALFTSLNGYLSLFLIAISGTVYKFVSIEYFKEEVPHKSIQYFTTAFYSILLLSASLLTVLYFLLPLLNHYVDFADNDVNDVKYFFMMSVSSFLMVNICAIFFVPTMIKSKLYLNDLSNILAVTIKFGVVILLYYVFDNLDLYTYGISLLIFGIVYLFISIFFAKKAIPAFSISYKYFKLTYAKNMFSMGWKVVVNNIGIILYTNTDIIIINTVLGTLFITDYSIPMQLAIIVAMFGGMMSRLYDPLLSPLISNGKNKVLRGRLISHTKIFTLFVGFIFIFLTVYSMKVLNLWLGAEYIRLYYILILLALYHFLHQSTVLFSRYFNLTNNLTIPLIVTLLAGVGNIFLSFAFLKFTGLGVIGVIMATLITVFLKTNLFNTLYTSFLLKISIRRLIKSFLPLYSYILVFSYLSFKLVQREITTFEFLDVFSISAIFLLYLGVAYFLLLDKKEKSIFLRMTKTHNLIRR